MSSPVPQSRVERATSYDAFPYPSSSFPDTHPNRLAAMARLMGVPAASPSSARVLELGCSDGGNLLPMAEMAPGSTYLGLDASRVQIAAGHKALAAVGLRNVQLRCQDILAFSKKEGSFDYIVVHGVFSWVPDRVREKILAIARAHLKPYGVAFISYNVLPGAAARDALRETLQFHTNMVADPLARVQRGRALVQVLAEAISTQEEPHIAALRFELRLIQRSPDHYFFHEFLEGESTPFFFHEFLRRAAKHGLQYVSEPSLAKMLGSRLSEKAGAALEKFEGQVSREQYLDLLRNRSFRQTLLCHAATVIDRTIKPDRMTQLAFSPLFRGPAEIDLKEDVPVEFAYAGEQRFEVRSTFVKAACQTLCDMPERAIGFAELLEAAWQRARPFLPTNLAGQQRADQARTLANELLRFLQRGVIQIHAEPVAASSAVPEKPLASAVNRFQAVNSELVTNRLHQVFSPDAFSRHVLGACDGTNAAAEIESVLRAKFAAGTLALREAGETVTSEDRLNEMLRPKVAAALQDLARHGVFTQPAGTSGAAQV